MAWEGLTDVTECRGYGFDSDDDGLSDSFEDGFGCEGIKIDNAASIPPNTASSTGDAAGGSTIASGDLTVTLPAGTTCETPTTGEIEIKFVSGENPKVEISGVSLPSGTTKTLAMPFGDQDAVCIDDQPNAEIETVDVGDCGSPKIEIAIPADGGSNTSGPYTVSRVGSIITIEGLLHTAIGTILDADLDTVQDADDNCPNDPNPDQADLDDDGIGDVCDPENTVPIDIKPGSDPNSINAASQGLIPLAILSTATFDATTVDGTTVRFGPAAASPQHDQTDSAVVADHQRDVDGDGLTDYVLHFRTGLTGISEGDTEACLTGQTFVSIAIEGCDAVRIVPPWLDSDGDGWGDAVEATLTTDQFAACSLDASHDAWPPDKDGNTTVGIDDVFFAAARFGAGVGDSNYTQRAEIASQDGVIGIDDVFAFASRFNQSC